MLRGSFPIGFNEILIGRQNPSYLRENPSYLHDISFCAKIKNIATVLPNIEILIGLQNPSYLRENPSYLREMYF